MFGWNRNRGPKIEAAPAAFVMHGPNIDKAQSENTKFVLSSVSQYDAGNKQGKQRPFDYHVAVGQYRGWVYAAARLNACSVAQTPLRMYVRKRGGTKLTETRKVSPERKRYLRGEKFNAKGMRFGPSSYVMQKAAEWADEFEEVTEKPQLLKVLQSPNPWMTGFEFTQMRMMFLQLTGNFYMHPVLESARISGDAHTRVKELWVVPSQYVTIVPGKGGTWIEEYIYGVNTTVQRRFPIDEIKHLKLPNPGNQFYGLGVVEAGWSVLRLSQAQREEDQAKKDNQSRPDLAVITESANVTPAQLNEMQNNWANLFRGTFRSGSPVFLTGKTQVIPLNWAPTELGDREVIVEEIAAVCGVPVSMLKANDPNLASAEVGFASWRENTTLPYCRMDEEYLNTSLLPIYGIQEDAFLAYDNPVPENRDQLRNDIQVYVSNGIWTRNEGRVATGEEPIKEENADKLLVPSGLQPIDKVGEMPALGPLQFTMGDAHRKDIHAGKLNFTIGSSAVAGIGGVGGAGDSRQQRQTDVDEERRRLGHHDHKSTVRQSEDVYTYHKSDDTARDGERERPIREMTARLNAVFAAQRVFLLRALEAGDVSQLDAKRFWWVQKDRSDLTLDMPEIRELLSELRKFNSDIADAIAPYIEAQLVNGGGMGLAEINLPADTFTLVNPRVAQFIESYSIRLAGKINDYSIQRLGESLSRGVEAGESTGALAQRVGGVFDEFTGYRSEMIARTESARAFVAGTEQAWKESGVVQGKRWLLASAACPVCRAIASHHKEAIPLDTPFFPLGSEIPLGDGRVFKVDYSSIMGPPGHPHCRCGIKAELKED